MRVQYQWTQRDWHEAVSLAKRRGGKRGQSMPGLTLALIGIPLIGAGADLLENLRTSRQVHMADAKLPLLLVALAAVVAILLAITKAQRTRQHLQDASMPLGEFEAILQESGWCFRKQVLSVEGTTALKSWSDVRETRRGNRVLVLMQADGFDALPLSSLTPDQDSHMHRLVTRKLRPPVS